jgi:hypothetical protein
MAATPKSQVLRLYRDLHRLVRLLGPKKQAEALPQLRSEFKEHKSESDAGKIQDLIKHGESKLGFLKMIAPRKGRVFGTTGKFVMKDGELVPGNSQKEALYFTDKRIDPADYERHVRLLRRQHFMDRHLPLRSSDVFEKPKIVTTTYNDD